MIALALHGVHVRYGTVCTVRYFVLASESYLQYMQRTTRLLLRKLVDRDSGTALTLLFNRLYTSVVTEAPLARFKSLSTFNMVQNYTLSHRYPGGSVVAYPLYRQ